MITLSEDAADVADVELDMGTVVVGRDDVDEDEVVVMTVVLKLVMLALVLMIEYLGVKVVDGLVVVEDDVVVDLMVVVELLVGLTSLSAWIQYEWSSK